MNAALQVIWDEPKLPPELAQAVAAMAAHQRTASMAMRATQAPPVPPAAPGLPRQPRYPLVTDHLLDGLAHDIQDLPEAEEREAILQAHDHITAALKQHGKFVVNGRLGMLDSPARAAQLAAQIINQKIAEVDRSQQEAAARREAPPQAPQPPQPAGPDEIARALNGLGYEAGRPIAIGSRLFFPVRRRAANGRLRP